MSKTAQLAAIVCLGALAIAQTSSAAQPAVNVQPGQTAAVGCASLPREVGSCDTPGDANGVAVHSSFAFAANRDGGLWVTDVSGPLRRREVTPVPAMMPEREQIGESR